MASNDPVPGAARCQADKQYDVRQARDLRAQAARLAMELADAGEAVAATLASMARQYPERGEHLRRLSDRARLSAARARRAGQ